MSVVLTYFSVSARSEFFIEINIFESSRQTTVDILDVKRKTLSKANLSNTRCNKQSPSKFEETMMPLRIRLKCFKMLYQAYFLSKAFFSVNQTEYISIKIKNLFMDMLISNLNPVIVIDRK